MNNFEQSNDNSIEQQGMMDRLNEKFPKLKTLILCLLTTTGAMSVPDFARASNIDEGKLKAPTYSSHLTIDSYDAESDIDLTTLAGKKLQVETHAVSEITEDEQLYDEKTNISVIENNDLEYADKTTIKALGETKNQAIDAALAEATSSRSSNVSVISESTSTNTTVNFYEKVKKDSDVTNMTFQVSNVKELDSKDGKVFEVTLNVMYGK